MHEYVALKYAGSGNQYLSLRTRPKGVGVIDCKVRAPKIALFGHFGGGNFGNEITLQAMLREIRRRLPDANVVCITTFPYEVATTYHVNAIPISRAVVPSWKNRGTFARWFRRLSVGVPSELYRFVRAIGDLWGAESLVIVGTGLLTDAFSLGGGDRTV